jgi:hypothetical protein
MSHFERYLRPRPPLPRSAWLLPIALFAAACALGAYGTAASSRLASLQVRNDALLATQSAKPAPRARPADIEFQKRWSDLVRERDFPWERIFAAVERADRTTIELLEFRPDKRTRWILLRGEARDTNALTSYLEALSDDPSVGSVYLVHRQTVVRNPLTTVGFEVKVRLRDLQ